MEQKKNCFVCKEEKKLTEFYRHPDMPDGTVNKCKDCNKKQNKYNWWIKREEKREYDLYRHRYSIQRIFNHRFAGIKRRCEIGGMNGHKYRVTGTEYLSKKDFTEWCYVPKNYKTFMNLYLNWVKNDFAHKYSPSIDRINNKETYTLNNIRWITQGENSSKGNRERTI